MDNNGQQLTYEELLAKVNQLEKDKANKTAKGTSLRISEKGALSVYGLGRFPVTLYLGQMERFIALVPEIQAFIEANRSKFAVKPEAAAKA